MRSVSFMAAGLILMVSGLAAAPSTPAQPSLAAEIDRFVGDYLAGAGLRGAAVVVTKGHDVIVARGYGTDSRGAPITAATPLPIASLSKSFTSLAVMQLVERGDVSLDAPVVRYLPEFSTADARGHDITVRQLLAHTSGLSDRAFPEKSGPMPRSLRAAVALLKTVTLSADPGTRTQYHNPNYWIAARLVEVVSRQSFRDYLHDHVFDPLGMRATATVGGLRDAPGVARGYVRFCGRSRSPSGFWTVRRESSRRRTIWRSGSSFTTPTAWPRMARAWSLPRRCGGCMTAWAGAASCRTACAACGCSNMKG